MFVYECTSIVDFVAQPVLPADFLNSRLLVCLAYRLLFYVQFYTYLIYVFNCCCAVQRTVYVA